MIQNNLKAIVEKYFEDPNFIVEAKPRKDFLEDMEISTINEWLKYIRCEKDIPLNVAKNLATFFQVSIDELAGKEVSHEN